MTSAEEEEEAGGRGGEGRGRFAERGVRVRVTKKG